MATSYTAQKANPAASYRFAVIFAGNNTGATFADAGFSRIGGLAASTEVIRYREGGQTSSPRKFAGMTDFPALTFERGVTTNMDMYNWAASCWVLNPNNTPLPETYDGTGYRRNLVINAYDNDFTTVVRSWEIIAAWPSEVSFGDFDAMGSSVLIERMVLQCEGIVPAAGSLGSTANVLSGLPTV